MAYLDNIHQQSSNDIFCCFSHVASVSQRSARPTQRISSFRRFAHVVQNRSSPLENSVASTVQCSCRPNRWARKLSHTEKINTTTRTVLERLDRVLERYTNNAGIFECCVLLNVCSLREHPTWKKTSHLHTGCLFRKTWFHMHPTL